MSPRLRRRPQALAFLALSGLLAAGCTSEGPAEPGTPGGPEPPAVIEELPRPLSASEREVLGASNRFAFRLARELVPPPTANLFFSPLSASMALGMTLNGAAGTTFDQMREVLGFGGLEREEINAAYRELLDLLTGLDPSVTVAIGNSIWYEEGYPVLPDFLARVEEAFEAEVAEVDFGGADALPRINGWVEEATNGTIETIFDRLPANVVMVLLNAIYFQGSWTAEFDPESTRTGPFVRGDGSTVSVPLMSRDAPVPYATGSGWAAVDLPYGGEAFRMTVVLPDPGSSPADVLAELDPDGWETLTESFDSVRLELTLPRFELEWEAELNEPLQALGMTDAFDAGRADFGAMVPGGGVWVDLVKQKSFVRVDEEGTEASAATGVVVVESAPPAFRVDRPFLFAIRERLSGTILFMGIVNDPGA